MQKSDHNEGKEDFKKFKVAKEKLSTGNMIAARKITNDVKRKSICLCS